MMLNQMLRRALLMPASELPVRLVHPHTALTPAELAQVRLDLELVEPKACNWQKRLRNVDTNELRIVSECDQAATVQCLLACGAVSYWCDEHRLQTTPRAGCGCGWRGADRRDHIVAELPL